MQTQLSRTRTLKVKPGVSLAACLPVDVPFVAVFSPQYVFHLCLSSVICTFFFCLFSPPNLYCPLQSFSPPIHPSFVKGVCFSISCQVFYLKCLLFRLSCSCCFFLSLVQCTARRFGNLSINSIWQPAGRPQNSEPKQAPNSSVQSKSVMGRRQNHPVLP